MKDKDNMMEGCLMGNITSDNNDNSNNALTNGSFSVVKWKIYE